jgi:hypothetical protein
LSEVAIETNLKQDLVPISLYAIFGVVISLGGIALGLNQIVGLSLSTALLIEPVYLPPIRFRSLPYFES